MGYSVTCLQIFKGQIKDNFEISVQTLLAIKIKKYLSNLIKIRKTNQITKLG